MHTEHLADVELQLLGCKRFESSLTAVSVFHATPSHTLHNFNWSADHLSKSLGSHAYMFVSSNTGEVALVICGSWLWVAIGGLSIGALHYLQGFLRFGPPYLTCFCLDLWKRHTFLVIVPICQIVVTA